MRTWAQVASTMNSAILPLEFSKAAVTAWEVLDPKYVNWPVVYILDDGNRASRATVRDIYVGESLSASRRLRQHLDTPAKQHLHNVRVLLDPTFNKSVCLDLESYLIKMLAGDGSNRVLNRNNGIVDADYYDRQRYRLGFRRIFDLLKDEGVFSRSINEIENSDLFKLSPFKALTDDQAASVEEVIRGLFVDLHAGTNSSTVIQGDPGTGKTVVAIYMMKLLMDIKEYTSIEDLDPASRFAEFFTDRNRDILRRLRIGMLVPQQSLRKSIAKVFKKTPGLHQSMIMTPFEVAEAEGMFDLLLVDETHRLNQRANQPSAVLNTKFTSITETLFGSNDLSKTQLDWVQAKSRHQIYFVDTAQSVRPADLPLEVLSNLIARAETYRRYFRLRSQMRIRAGSDYVTYIRQIFDPTPVAVRPAARTFGEYDLLLFDNISDMRNMIFQRESVFSLSRMVAGYAWEWRSKNDKLAYDIEIDSLRLRWNGVPLDWIASPNALEEVGSIHTVQGYDLNYTGVIIGFDLGYDIEQKSLYFRRSSYFDKKGKENNPVLGKKYTDSDLLRFVTQIYAVLLTRGIRGTYVYACDPGLREYLRSYIPLYEKN